MNTFNVIKYHSGISLYHYSRKMKDKDIMSTTIKPKVGDVIVIRHRLGKEPDYIGILVGYYNYLGDQGFNIRWNRGSPQNFWSNSVINSVINGKTTSYDWIYIFHPRKTPYEDESYKDLWV